MFKKISEAYAILSNPDRRKKYDKWGQTGKDDDFGFGDGDEFEAFMGMFGMSGGVFGGSFDEDFEDFISFLEKDYLKFKQFFRGLGRNYRGPIGQKRGNLRSKAKKMHGAGGGSRKKEKQEEEMMEEMMAAMMMGDLGGKKGKMDPMEEMMMAEMMKEMGGKGKKGKKGKKKADSESDSDEEAMMEEMMAAMMSGKGAGGKGKKGKSGDPMMDKMMAAMMMGDMLSKGMDDDDLEEGFGFGMDFGKKKSKDKKT